MPGGAAGGGGTGASGSTATVYQPSASPQADQFYQQIVQGLMPLALDPSLTPAGQNYPAAQQGAQMVTGNPYFDQLTSGANATVPFSNQLYGSAIGPAQQQFDQFANQATAATGSYGPQQAFYPSLMGQVQNNPYLPQALSGQGAAASYGAGTAGGAYQGGQNALADSQSVRSLFGQQTALGNQIPGATNSLFPEMTNLSHMLGGDVNSLFGQMTGLGNQISSQYMDPTAGLAGKVGGYMDPTAGLAGQVAGLAPQVAAPMGGLQNYANSVLNAGFDPQQGLYNRTFDQLRNQTQAQSALSGVGNTPYGASVVDNALGKFSTDWQNNLLNRMATAGTAAQGLDATAGNLGTQAGGLLNQAGNLYGQAGNLGAQSGGLYNTAAGIGNIANNIYSQAGNEITSGLGATNSILGQAGNTLNSGLNTASNIYGQAANTLGQGYNIAQQGLGLGQGATNLQSSASNMPLGTYDQYLNQQLQAANAGVTAGQTGASTLGTLGNLLSGARQGQQSVGASGFQNLMSSLQAPYNAQNIQGGNIQTAMSNLTQAGNNQYLMPQQVLNDLQSYLHMGQSASQISGQLGNLGQQQLSNSLQGVGQLAGMAGNPFSSSSTGLLGGAFTGGGTGGSLASMGVGGLPASEGFGTLGMTLGGLGGDALAAGGATAAAAGGAGKGAAEMLPLMVALAA